MTRIARDLRAQKPLLYRPLIVSGTSSVVIGGYRLGRVLQGPPVSGAPITIWSDSPLRGQSSLCALRQSELLPEAPVSLRAAVLANTAFSLTSTKKWTSWRKRILRCPSVLPSSAGSTCSKKPLLFGGGRVEKLRKSGLEPRKCSTSRKTERKLLQLVWRRKETEQRGMISLGRSEKQSPKTYLYHHL